MTPTLLPPPLIDRYWFEVEWELRHRYLLTPAQAADAVAEYRRRLAAAGVGDAVYHSDVRETAAVIAGQPTP